MGRPLVQPSVAALAEFRAVTLALKAAGKDLRKDINKATRDTINPVWRDAVSRHASTTLDRLVLVKGARIAAGNPSQAVAGSSTKALPGGLVPAKHAAAFEFGVPNPHVYTDYSRRHPRSGKVHDVRRRTMTGLPIRKNNGRVIYPAFAETAPRMVSLWTQLIMRKVYDAFK